MAATRKALAYSKRKPVTNTRKSKKQRFNYVKVVPPQKIVKFNMGKATDLERGVYKYQIVISTTENIQIRDLALEAGRQSLHKNLAKLLQQKFYYLKCHPYPHNILRNNRVYSGGSKGERVQTGMTKSFGSPDGRAAVVKKGKPIFTAYFNGETNIPAIRKIFKSTSPKFPCKTKIIVSIIDKKKVGIKKKVEEKKVELEK